jgi:hypothetical protein
MPLTTNYRRKDGVAHDFNNVLAGVFAYGEMLFEETSENSPLKRYAKNVLTAAVTDVTFEQRAGSMR